MFKLFTASTIHRLPLLILTTILCGSTLQFLRDVNAQEDSYILTLRRDANFKNTVSTFGRIFEDDNQFRTSRRPPWNTTVNAAGVTDKSGRVWTEAAKKKYYMRNWIRHEYDNNMVTAVAVQMTPEMAQAVASRPEVASITPDGRVRVATEQQFAPNWGLTRISERDLDLENNTSYMYPSNGGRGATVWVVDTGITATHPDFEGRAIHGRSFCTNCTDFDDHGHGTAVAGIIASKTFGVAKSAIVVGVKALNADGEGSWSDVLAALNWIYRQASRMAEVKHIINLSLVGEVNWFVNMFISELTEHGIHVVVAAGNSADVACNYSPASAPTAISVGAIDSTDAVAYFSNFGSCVTLFAPGEQIHTTTKDGGDDDDFTGTSFAAPHVAGVAALYISQFPWLTTAALRRALIDNASRNRIPVKSLPLDSPNLIVYNFLSNDPDGTESAAVGKINAILPITSNSTATKVATTSTVDVTFTTVVNNTATNTVGILPTSVINTDISAVTTTTIAAIPTTAVTTLSR